VETGDVVAVVEAMKMENAVLAHKAGIVANVLVATGDQTAQDAALCEIKDVSLRCQTAA
jgi:acetyl-CoA/propionyl-CoA carboxylase, biotin carboxylase, biotin carboxyl carrier protein